jgi:hypothetical protein
LRVHLYARIMSIWTCILSMSVYKPLVLFVSFLFWFTWVLLSEGLYECVHVYTYIIMQNIYAESWTHSWHFFKTIYPFFSSRDWIWVSRWWTLHTCHAQKFLVDNFDKYDTFTMLFKTIYPFYSATDSDSVAWLPSAEFHMDNFVPKSGGLQFWHIYDISENDTFMSWCCFCFGWQQA